MKETPAQKIKRLERALSDEKLKNKVLNTMIYISGQQYGTAIRKIMGYYLSDDMSAENVVKAMKMATQKRVTATELVHHSDRGLQYCS